MEDNNSDLRGLVKKLYVKLYLFRQIKEGSNKIKCSSQKKITSIKDATQSWNSLNSADKEIFLELIIKRTSHRKAVIANFLTTASPKQVKRNISNRKDGQCANKANVSRPERNIKHVENGTSSGSFEPDNEHSNHIVSSEILDSESISGEKAESVNPWHKPLNFPRPEPPTALNAHQLFDLVNEEKNEGYHPWNTLATTDKRRYQEALRKLKKQFLKKYELYLQELTSEQLYYHMIDIHSNTLWL